MLIDCHSDVLDAIQVVAGPRAQDLEASLQIEEQKLLITHLLANESAWSGTVGSACLRKNESDTGTLKTYHPMYGRLNSYPFYAMAISQLDSHGDRSTDYNRLKAIMLLAHWMLLSKLFEDPADSYLNKQQDKKYLSGATASLQASTRLVRQCRQLIRFNDYGKLHNLKTADNLFELLKNLNGHVERDAAESEIRNARLHNELFAFFNRAFISKDAFGEKGSSRGGGRHGGKSYWHDGYVFYSDGAQAEQTISEDGGRITVLSAPVADVDLEELKLAGLDPSENQSGVEYILPESSSRSRRMLSRRMVRFIEMGNQHFRTQWTQSSVYEVSALLNKCQSTLRSPEKSLNEKKTVLLILVMFWTGSSLENVIENFRVYPTHESEEKKSFPCLVQSEHNGEWHFCLTPETARQQFPESNYKDCKRYSDANLTKICLPDLAGVGDYITSVFTSGDFKGAPALFKEKGIKITLSYGNSVKDFASEYRGIISKVIKALPKGNRLNEYRISSYLPHMMASEISGDVAEPLLLTGRYSTLGQTLLHYTAFEPAYLQRMYADVVMKISELTGCSLHGSSQLRGEALENEHGRIGSLLMPNRYKVKEVEEYLRKEIGNFKNTGDTAKIVKVHNLYTMYTVMMQGYATGFRAIVDPFPKDDCIDDATGLCVISDKDGDDYYNSRLIWIPPDVMLQREHYKKHRNRIHSMIQSHHPELKDAVGDVFLLSEAFELLEVRPRNIKEVMKNIFPLPVNTNRRYLRTRLRELGCPAEVVNSFMGHWGRGQEPWGRFSSVSPIAMIEAVKPYILKILDELGFRPIKGPLR
tara:strand:+ start:9065 stop:11506 length:2442 start_codon:yes stop_codon:yes gene_type:complete